MCAQAVKRPLVCIRLAQAVGGTTFQLVVTTWPDFKVSAKAAGQVVFEFQSLSWFVYKGFEKANTFKYTRDVWRVLCRCYPIIETLIGWFNIWLVGLFVLCHQWFVYLSFCLFLYLEELRNWMRLFLFCTPGWIDCCGVAIVPSLISRVLCVSLLLLSTHYRVSPPPA